MKYFLKINFRQVLNWLIILIAFFLPFEYLSSFEFKGLTIRISQILTLILIIIWFLAFIAKRIDYKKNYLTAPLLVFLIINLFSLIKATDLGRSLAVFSFLLFTALFSWLIPQIARSKKDLRNIIIALFLSSLIVSLFGFWQFFGDAAGISPKWTGLRSNYVKEKIGFPRIHSTTYEPLYYANYLFIPLFLALALWIKRREPKGKPMVSASDGLGNFPIPIYSPSRLWEAVRGWVMVHYNFWLIFLIFLILSNLILTVARGAYFALIPSLLILVILFKKELKKSKKLIALILFVSLTIILNWQFIRYFDQSSYFLNQLKYEEHVLNFLGGSSYKERKETIALAWQAFKENPILGLGVGGFGPYAKIHLPWWQRDVWKIVNNEYLEILAETGILGFFAFIAMVAIIIYKSLKAIYQTKEDFLKAALIGFLIALIAILIQYITFSTLYIMHIWFLVGMLVAVNKIKENSEV